jgi:hypothetical protein
MRASKEHTEIIAGRTGKCGVPMWQSGCPSGFCDREAYGQYSLLTPWRDTPYSAGWRCNHHGGPAEDGVRIIVDGLTNDGRPMFMAYRSGFENLQESNAGFGPSPDYAYADLLTARQNGAK